MALVPSRRNRNNASSLSALIPAMGGVAGRALDTAVKQIVNSVLQSKTSGSRNNGQSNNGGTQLSSPKRRQRKTKQQPNLTDPYKSIHVSGSARGALKMKLFTSYILTNGAVAGTSANTWAVSYNSATANAGDLFAALSLQDKNLVAAFQYFNVSKLKMKWDGIGASTTSGYLSLGYRTSPSAIVPGSYGDITASNQYDVADVKGTAQLIVFPKTPPLFVNESAQDAMHRAAGLILMRSENNLAALDKVGILTVETDVSLW